MIGTFAASIGHAFRRTALPLLAYYGITLVVPLANGAAQAGTSFVEHATIVLVVPPAVIVVACIGHTMASAFRSRAS